MSNELNTLNQAVESPLDAIFLFGQVGRNIEIAKWIATEFANQAMTDQEQLRQCLAAKDLPAARQLACYLKGTYCMLGAKRLCALAAELEVACGKNHKTVAYVTYRMLCKEITHCAEYVPTLLQQLDDSIHNDLRLLPEQ
jgi:HPt (histidine-containing phosphotransfer) domain-containing protein